MVATVYSVLARILDDAVRDRMLAANPARGVKLPKRPPRRNVYLSVEQLNRLADESGRYRSLVLLLGVGGLRWGEAAALRVCDVDFLRRRVDAAPQRRQGRQRVRGRVAQEQQEPHGGAARVRRRRAGRRPPRARAATICCGPRRQADTSGHRRRTSRGCRARWHGARRPTRPSRESRPTTCGTPPRRWRSAPGRTRRWFSGCSGTLGGDDARRVRRSVRVRPRCGRRLARKCAQNVPTECSVARAVRHRKRLYQRDMSDTRRCPR